MSGRRWPAVRSGERGDARQQQGCACAGPPLRCQAPRAHVERRKRRRARPGLRLTSPDPPCAAPRHESAAGGFVGYMQEQEEAALRDALRTLTKRQAAMAR